MEKDSLELIDYLRGLWKRKLLIVTGTVLFMVVAALVSLLQTRVFEASVVFLLEESKISPESVVSQINPKLFDTYGKTYEGIIKNKSALNQAIEKFRLDREPYGTTLKDLDNSISVKAVKNSKLLELSVEFPEPVMARDIANFLADKAVELNSALSAAGSAEKRDFINEEMETARQNMDRAEDELLKFEENAQLKTLRKKVEILLGRKGEIENGISHAEVDIAGLEESLKKIEEEFKKRDRTVKLSRKLAEDPLFQQSLAGLSESDIKKTFNLDMEVEIKDPTYEHLEKRLVNVVADLSGIYARRGSLGKELKKNTAQLKTLQADLAGKETELKRLKRELGLAVDTYKMLTRKFEEVTLQVASRSQDLKIIDPAVTPDRPTRPRKVLNVLVAGILGLAVFPFLAFFLEYLEGVRRREGDI
jgi:uncharacterized protein involved in exopolysaccharide biosynthesis